MIRTAVVNLSRVPQAACRAGWLEFTPEVRRAAVRACNQQQQHYVIRLVQRWSSGLWYCEVAHVDPIHARVRGVQLDEIYTAVEEHFMKA